MYAILESARCTAVSPVSLPVTPSSHCRESILHSLLSAKKMPLHSVSNGDEFSERVLPNPLSGNAVKGKWKTSAILPKVDSNVSLSGFGMALVLFR